MTLSKALCVYFLLVLATNCPHAEEHPQEKENLYHFVVKEIERPRLDDEYFEQHVTVIETQILFLCKQKAISRNLECKLHKVEFRRNKPSLPSEKELLNDKGLSEMQEGMCKDKGVRDIIAGKPNPNFTELARDLKETFSGLCGTQQDASKFLARLESEHLAACRLFDYFGPDEKIYQQVTQNKWVLAGSGLDKKIETLSYEEVFPGTNVKGWKYVVEGVWPRIGNEQEKNFRGVYKTMSSSSELQFKIPPGCNTIELE